MCARHGKRSNPKPPRSVWITALILFLLGVIYVQFPLCAVWGNRCAGLCFSSIPGREILAQTDSSSWLSALVREGGKRYLYWLSGSLSAILRFLLVSTCVCPCGPGLYVGRASPRSARNLRSHFPGQGQRSALSARAVTSAVNATYGMNRQQRLRGAHAGCSARPPDTGALWSGEMEVCRVKRHCDHCSECLSFTVLMSCGKTSRDCVVQLKAWKRV